MERLYVRDADKRADDHALLRFRCSTGEEEEIWIREVEEYVRRYALPTAHRVLLFETESRELAGVTAFNREDISPSGRLRVGGWRLEVVALSPFWWGKAIDARP